MLPRKVRDRTHERSEGMELQVCLSKAMVMGLCEGKSLCLRLEIGDSEEGLAAGERVVPFAEEVWRCRGG